MKKVEKLDNSHIAQDILKQHKELKATPLTLEEIAEATASEYLTKKKKHLLPTYSQEQWDELLKKVIAATGLSHPEKNTEFLENIPEMHRCWSAIRTIGKSEHLAELYALVMTKIYKEGIPFEIEKVILALDEEELIFQLAKRHYTWSHRAERIMSCLHPKAHKKIFAEERESMAIIFA